MHGRLSASKSSFVVPLGMWVVRSVKPVLHALLLADHVYHDKETGKKVVAGIFDQIVLMKCEVSADHADQPQTVTMPAERVRRAGSPYVYINLRDVRGGTPLELRLVHLESNEVVFRTNSFKVECDDPLRSVELVIPVPDLPREPGTYALELLREDEVIGSHRVVVREAEQRE